MRGIALNMPRIVKCKERRSSGANGGEIMDKLVPVVINGDAHYLNYSIEVMFDVNDKYGGIREALELMSGDKRESFEVVRWFLANCAAACMGMIMVRCSRKKTCPCASVLWSTPRSNPRWSTRSTAAI